MTQLSDTQALILSAAAQRPEHIALPLPESLRGGAGAKVVAAMIAKGLLEEVEGLRQRSDLHPGLPSIRAVGYRQVWDYLDGNLSRAQMEEQGIIATRQLAKRQFTWLRGWGDAHWLDSLDCDNLPRALKYLAAVSILT